jgi:hypothetical protein
MKFVLEYVTIFQVLSPPIPRNARIAVIVMRIISCAVVFTLVFGPSHWDGTRSAESPVCAYGMPSSSQLWPFNVIFDVRTEQKHLLTNQLLGGLLSLKRRGVLRSRNEQKDHEHPKRLWNASDSHV